MPGESERAGPLVVGTGHEQGMRHPLLGPAARHQDRQRASHRGSEQMTFDRTQGPTEVRSAVASAVGEAAPHDPWAEIEEKEGPLAVGRMRLMGVYDDRQRDRFMLRVRIPGGQISADQVDVVAGIIRDFGNGWDDAVEPDRFGEITTRQDIQVHWVEFPALPEIWRRLRRGRHDERAGLRRLDAEPDRLRRRRRRHARLPDRRPAPGGVPSLRAGRGEADRVPAPQVEGRGDGLPRRLRGGQAALPGVHAGARLPTARSGSTCTPAAGSQRLATDRRRARPVRHAPTR